MSRIAYVNGRFVPHKSAGVHIEDRGYQFADGVYEVCEVRNGKVIDARRHLDRLGRSLSELSIAWPMERAAMAVLMCELLSKNRIRNGLIYIQVTRGAAPRNHIFPAKETPPAIVMTAKKTDPAAAEKTAEKGISVISVPDNRWDRVDIKTVGLLPNCMARQKAIEAGAKEAVFVDDEGYVTEGGATNVWIVTGDNELVTRPAESGILKGITRTVVIDMLKAQGITLVERRFTIEEAQNAREVFITAASTLVMPVVEVDGKPVGNGSPGITTGKLREKFHDYAESSPIADIRETLRHIA